MIGYRLFDCISGNFVLLKLSKGHGQWKTQCYYLLYSYLREKSYEKFIEFR